MRKDAFNPAPRYRMLYESLRGRILAGEFPAGETLPGENVIARENKISRITVRSAMNVLRRDGLIVTVPGLGHRVANPVLKISETRPLLFIGRRDNVALMLFESVHRKSLEMGLDCRLMSYSNRFDTDILDFDDAFISSIDRNAVSGIVFFSDKKPGPQILSFIKKNNIKIILAGYAGLDFCDSVLSDNIGAGRKLCDELHKRGFRNFLYVSDDYLERNIETFKDRARAFAERARLLSSAVFTINVQHNNPQYDINKYTVAKIVDKIKRGVDCLVASNALLAERFRQVLAGEGLSCPSKISIATFISDDNYYRENGVLRRIGGMEENWTQIGSRACETLISKVRNGGYDWSVILVPMKFMEGDSMARRNHDGKDIVKSFVTERSGPGVKSKKQHLSLKIC